MPNPLVPVTLPIPPRDMDPLVPATNEPRGPVAAGGVVAVGPDATVAGGVVAVGPKATAAGGVLVVGPTAMAAGGVVAVGPAAKPTGGVVVVVPAAALMAVVGSVSGGAAVAGVVRMALLVAVRRFQLLDARRLALELRPRVEEVVDSLVDVGDVGLGAGGDEVGHLSEELVGADHAG